MNRRTPPEFTSVHENEKVIVRGVVNAPVYHFPQYSILGIQDSNSGVTLKAMSPDNRLEGYHPGDELEAAGTVTVYAGAICIVPDSVALLGHKAAPAPLEVSGQDLSNLKYLGRLVNTRGHLRQAGETTAGALLVTESQMRIFMPRPRSQTTPNFNSYSVGDDVRSGGVLFQYCPRAPYTSGFEVLVHDTSEVIRSQAPWSVSPFILVAGLSAVLLIGFYLWSRERRLKNQRERLRRTFQLGEEILGAASASAILKRISDALPGILEITSVHLYVFNRAAKTLDSITEQPGEPVSISLTAPPPGTQAGAVACFHYRTLLVIPDIDRSPFPIAGNPENLAPKSLLFVPMLAQGEVTGVLELDQDDRTRDFTADEQALAQHLGNQIGVAIRLLGQRSVQEQLFRTEKLAAVGRLISGVVNELQAPLASISDLASRALDKPRSGGGDERELAAIAAESQKAAAMVARLVSFASAEQGEARQVPIGHLLRNLIEFREGDWKASGIRVRDLTSREPFYVLGLQGQLEQVFLNLLVHAEQSLAESPQKVITIRTSVLAKRLLVEIGFSAPPELRKPEETAAVLGVTRSVVAGHGGEVRLIDKANADPRFEVELPISMKDRVAATPSTGAPVESSRRMTALVIEPDDAAQRQLVAFLSSRGYRVVPVVNSDTGLELAHRMRFDAAFCSVHAPGLNWVELSERMHLRVGGFILVSDGYDAELSSDFEGDGRFVLPKPVQEPELERVLRTIDRMTAAKVVPIKNGVA